MKILKELGTHEADCFKNSIIPSRLYKYFPPERNRIDALCNRKLWLGRYDTFNDPHEFSFMKLNEAYFKHPNLTDPFLKEKYSSNQNLLHMNYSAVLKWLEQFKRIVTISCFTTDPQNFDFWRDYAADFTGFCVEYEVKRKDIFYPVIYTDRKIDVSEFAYNSIVRFCDLIEQEEQLSAEWKRSVNLISSDSMDDCSFLYFDYCTKEIKWRKENEFRIVFANPQPQTEKGKLVSYQDLGIIPLNVFFFPDKCNTDIKAELMRISSRITPTYLSM